MTIRSPRLAATSVFFFAGALFGAWAARIPAFKDRFELQPDTLGLFLLLLAGGAILSFPIAGRAADRWGSAAITKIILPLNALAFIALGFSTDLLSFGLAILAFGATHGAMDVTMNAWGAEVEARSDRAVLPSMHAMFSVGAGAGAASGAFATLLSWDTGLHYLVVSIVLTAICGWLMAIPWKSPEPETTEKSGMFPFPTGALLIVGILAFCGAIGEGAMVDWSAVYLVAVVNASETQAALGFTVFSITMVSVRFGGEFLIPKLGRVLAARLSGLLAAIGALIAVTGIGLETVLLGFALMGCGYALIMPLVFSRAAEQGATGAGLNIAKVATLAYGGMLLGPPLIGFIADDFGFQVAFAVIAALAGIVFLLATALRPQ